MPGNVVDTDTISKADKKRANINDRVTRKSFLGGISEDWSAMETNLRSRSLDGGAVSSRVVAAIADETEEGSSVDEGDVMVEVIK